MSSRSRRVRSALNNNGTVVTALAVTAVAITLGAYIYRRWYTGRQNGSSRTSGRPGDPSQSTTTTNRTTSENSIARRDRSLRTMTISLRNVILWNPSPDPTAPTLGFLQNAVTLLRYFAEKYDLYLVMSVKTHEERTEVMRLLRDAQLIRSVDDTSEDAPGKARIDEHKVLFCETEAGTTHIIRHLSPNIHVESDFKTVQDVRTFVGQVIWICPQGTQSNDVNGTDVKVLLAKTTTGRSAPVSIATSLAECSLSPLQHVK